MSEAQREAPVERPASRPQVTGWQRSVVLFLDRQIYRLSRHWVAVFNTFLGVYALLPVLAPALMASGWPQIGRLIYVVYRPACHQLPERSFYLFGPQAQYSADELWALGQIDDPKDQLGHQDLIGSPEIGYKLAFCQRDTAMYGSLFLGGLLYSLVRKRLHPLPFLAYGLCLLPMLVDGATQLLLLRESNWVLRVVSGTIAGLATIWLVYPYLKQAFGEIRQQANARVRMD